MSPSVSAPPAPLAPPAGVPAGVAAAPPLPLAAAPLAPPRRATLAAVCARILDGAAGRTADRDPVALVEARLARVPPALRGDLLQVLDVFGSRLAALVTVGRPVPFARLDAARQDAMLARWARSRVPLQRTVFQALRRLVLAVWYGQPAVQHALGHPGPLFPRLGMAGTELPLPDGLLPWEGPLPGRGSDAEPVARLVPGRRWAGAADGDEAVEAAPADAAARHEALRRALAAAPHADPATAHGIAFRGRDLAADVHRTADVVVIGSGAGGAVVAARLAEAGHEVVLVESGGLWTAADFVEEEAPLTERLYAVQGLQATDDLAVTMFQGDAVGGSTTVNWMLMLRPDPPVREEWARRFGVGAMVDGALDRALARVWDDVHARPVPPEAHSPNNRHLLAGAATLGWRAHGGEVNARGCVRAGFCGIGCRYDAKQGTLLTYVPRALAAGATLFADARATRVERRERGAGAGGRGPLRRVTAAVDGGRVTLTVDAPRVVLAGGAVGTPALLQRSALGPDAVGRWLRLHPTTAVLARYAEPVYAGSGMPMTTICDEFTAAGPNGYGFWIETPPVHPTLAGVALPGFGAPHAALARAYPHLGTFIVLVRDGADPQHDTGRVTVDRTGRIRLRYRLGPTDARHLREGMAAAARLHLAAGAEEARTLHTEAVVVRGEADLARIRAASVRPNDVGLFSAHVNGTARLGRTPEGPDAGACSSEAARFGALFGAPGVWVADGSLLPTGLGVNPQATIMALGHLVAEGMLG